MSDVDVLVLGATGFTGRLTTKYLASHPDRSSFRLGISVRSKAKGEDLLAKLSLSPDAVTVIELDVSNATLLEATIARTKVVINTVGPFWTHGTPVIMVCARLGKHYVDTTAETHWIYNVLNEVDTLASQSGAIIVPAGGMDSLPADLSAFLSVRALQDYCESSNTLWSGAASSLTGYDMTFEPSGGTLDTLGMMASGIIPHDLMKQSTQPYALSPVKGTQGAPKEKSVYRVHDSPHSWGSFYVMAVSNRAIADRSWGLFEKHAQETGTPGAAYGPKFQYDEVLLTSNPLSALLGSVSMAVVGMLLKLSTFRRIVKKFRPPGSGPSEASMKDGYIHTTNVTHLAGNAAIRARTDFVGRGDPGYLLTSVMISEMALGLLLNPPEKFGPIATAGGLLTPATALGHVLADRLRRTELFKITSEILT